MHLYISFLLFACRSDEKTIENPEVVDEDKDGDGFSGEDDCDDENPLINPQEEELCDGIDNNCDGIVDENVLQIFYVDADGDGFGDPEQMVENCEIQAGQTSNGSDCDDSTALVFPGAEEVCDELDNDCNGLVDDDVGILYFLDADGDGFGDETQQVILCEEEEGVTLVTGDCNDRNEQIYPEAPEFCDGLDNDCNEIVDDGDTFTFYEDVDTDGYGDPLSTMLGCSIPEGYTMNGNDCNDLDTNIHPMAQEQCNEADDNCNLLIDEGVQNTYYADADLDGFGNINNTVEACAAPSGFLLDATDCDDADNDIHPNASEICNEMDENCNGVVDEGVQNTYYLDNDGDGVGDSNSSVLACSGSSTLVSVNGDCDDANPLRAPGLEEVCDSIDNNCDGVVDEGMLNTYYLDADLDDYGVSTDTLEACTLPIGYAVVMGDCDDGSASISPDADELCNEVDDDCNGSVDDNAIDEVNWYLDYDEDGFGDDQFFIMSCAAPTGFVPDAGDCNDLDTSIYPNATEGCDGIDHNCDGAIDNDLDLDGYSDSDCGGMDCDDDDADSFPDSSGQCINALSCRDILDQGLDDGDGVYTIDPDGTGGEDPFAVYCDMTTDGGGWTLAMRFDSTSSTFTFNSPYWTNDAILNDSDLDPSGATDAKYSSFSMVTASSIRGCMENGLSSGCKSYDLPQDQTLLTLFSDTPVGSDSTGSGGLFFSETDSEKLEWLTIQGYAISDLSIISPIGYIRTGINIDDDMSCYDARIRFGLAINNQTNVYTLNDTAGFGSSAYYSGTCEYTVTEDSPWSVGAGMTCDKGLYDSAGTIWVY